MKIITDNLETKIPVHHRYPGQSEPQPAYIELDCRDGGTLSADYSGEIGNAVPAYNWHRLSVRWSIPPESTGDSIAKIFHDKPFRDLIHRIVDGFEEVWDGSNWAGSYTEDATDAIEEAAGIIENMVELAEVWDVDDWLFTSGKLRDHWSEQPLADAVAELESYVETNQVIDGNMEEALLKKATGYFYDDPESITEVHVAELLERGIITRAEAEEWRK